MIVSEVAQNVKVVAFFSSAKKMDELNEPQNCLKVTKDPIPVWTSRSQQPMSWPTQESQPKMTHL